MINVEERKERKRAYNRARYAANKEKIGAQTRAYAIDHPIQTRAHIYNHYIANKEKLNIYHRALKLTKRYGLTPDAFQNMIIRQGNKCAACHTKDWGTKGPYIDHDHATGKVRGILCVYCNTAAGMLKDDPARARLLADYLEAESKKEP